MILNEDNVRSIVENVIWQVESDPQCADVYISVDPEVVYPDIDIFKFFQSI